MTTQDQTATTRLWTEYKSTADRAVRDQLIVLYSPLVKFVAGRVAVGLPQHVEHADLVSYGVFGLIHAIERFDPVRQVKFETYAIPRIKGAIFDELRRNDWVPRSFENEGEGTGAGSLFARSPVAQGTDGCGARSRARVDRRRALRNPPADVAPRGRRPRRGLHGRRRQDREDHPR